MTSAPPTSTQPRLPSSLPFAIGAIGMLAGLVLMCVTARSAWRARAESQSAQAELVRVNTLVRELDALQVDEQQTMATNTRGSNLPPILTEVLGSVGLPSSVLASYSVNASKRAPTAETLGADEDVVIHERASLILSGLTLPQFGKFLAAWREAQPEWAITAIDLSPLPIPDERRSEGLSAKRSPKEPKPFQPRGGSDVGLDGAGGDRPLHATLTLEAIVESGRGGPVMNDARTDIDPTTVDQPETSR